MSKKRCSNDKLDATRAVISIILIIFLSCLSAGCQSTYKTMGEDLYQQALNLEKQKSFTQAASLYDQALPMLLEEKNMELATECSEALQRLTLFQAVYPYKTEQIKDILLHAYPQATTEQIKSWASSKEMEHYVWDGEEHYSADATQNLKFRYLELMQADRVMEKEYYDLVIDINNCTTKALV